MEVEFLQKSCQWRIRFSDATKAEIHAGFCGQYHVHQRQLSDLFDNLSWFVSQSGLFAHLPEALPQHVRKISDHDVCVDPGGFLMPYRTQAQVILVNAEGRLGLGQLDVRFPEFLAGPVLDIAP